MATKRIIKTTFQVRRGLSATWVKTNPVLAYGEPGFERDTYKLKIGDGTTAWNDLPYIRGDNYSQEGGLCDLIADVEKGVVYKKNADGTFTAVSELTERIENETIQKLFE